jgi:uncharacterized protein
MLVGDARERGEWRENLVQCGCVRRLAKKEPAVLVEFRVENFLSFRDEQRLSLVAGSTRESARNTLDVPALGRERLLRSAVIYGPNAAGKSNLLKALHFVQQLVTNLQASGGRGTQSFRLEPGMRDRPSRFDLVFVQAGVRYDYHLALVNTTIVSEELHAYPKGKRQRWYSRRHDPVSEQPEITFGPNLTGPIASFRQLVRPFAPFLAVVGLLNHQQLGPVFEWFSGKLSFWFQDTAPFNQAQAMRLMAEFVAGSPELHEPLARLLRMADLGIADLTVREEALVPVIGGRVAFPPGDDLAALAGERRRLLQLRHVASPGTGGDALFAIGDESHGTQQLFMLGTVLLAALRDGQVLVVDELDTGLHPRLVRALVELFHDENPRGAQLIFNTHDTSLLGGDLFEPDQVWFVEKDSRGASQLFPLLDFRLPPDERKQREEDYLHGRYGAIPFIDRDAWVKPTGDDAAS